MKLLRSSIAIGVSLLAGCAEVPRVSSSELLANPATYEGKRIKVEGHVSYGFENCAIDGVIWYWPQNESCYGFDSLQDAWEGDGYVIGTVSMANHGHLGMFPFTLVNAKVVRQ
jgi:hypothetical protein